MRSIAFYETALKPLGIVHALDSQPADRVLLQPIRSIFDP